MGATCQFSQNQDTTKSSDFEVFQIKSSMNNKKGGNKSNCPVYQNMECKNEAMKNQKQKNSPFFVIYCKSSDERSELIEELNVLNQEYRYNIKEYECEFYSKNSSSFDSLVESYFDLDNLLDGSFDYFQKT